MGLPRAAAIAGVLTLGVSVAAAGELAGVVRLEGQVPTPAVLTLEPKTGDHSTEGCGDLTKPSPRLLVAPDGGIQNAVVWLELPSQRQEPGPGTAPPNEPRARPGGRDVAPLGGSESVPAAQPGGSTKILDQRACVFEPHVMLMPVGGTLAIRNSDPMLHNVRIFRERVMLMHEWQQPQGPDLIWRVDEPGRFLVRCGVHSWMYAWVVVTDHRHAAVTDHAGAFTIPGVPEGSHTLHVWHETFGEHDQPIQVGRQGVFVAVRLSQEGGA